MAKYYKMVRKTDGHVSCVHEKYLNTKKGYVNTGIICGGSGADKPVKIETDNKTPIIENNETSVMNPKGLDFSFLSEQTVTGIFVVMIFMWVLGLGKRVL